MKKKVVVTGGTGRFGNILKSFKSRYKVFFPTKKDLDILNEKKIYKYLKKIKPNYLIHLAGLSRPMIDHEKNIKKSIDLNIIGTANITKACSLNNIKLIYFSTNYVYPGKRGNYKETDPLYLLIIMLGQNLVEKLLFNFIKFLILRVSMTEKPLYTQSICQCKN